MLIRKAFKFELLPSVEQKEKLEYFSECARLVYNKALETHKIERELDPNAKFKRFSIGLKVKDWRKEDPFLANGLCSSLHCAIEDLDRAFKNFFAKRARYPKFKAKGRKVGFRFQGNFAKIDQENNLISLPKIGWVRYRNSREVIGTIKNVSISCQAGRFFISLQTEYEIEVSPSRGGELAISFGRLNDDLKIDQFAFLSNGELIPTIKAFELHKKNLAKYQQKLKNKDTKSNNYKKLQCKIAKIHSKIANTRKDFLHKLTHHISTKNSAVFVEDVKVLDLILKAIDDESIDTKKKEEINRSILDQSWFEFVRQLSYKLAWNGGQLISVSNALNDLSADELCDGVCRAKKIMKHGKEALRKGN